jgi:hypothetical protein
MKKVINILCVVISAIFVIIGFSMFNDISVYGSVNYIEHAIRDAVYMLTGGLLILSGSLGLLIQIYIYNQDK